MVLNLFGQVTTPGKEKQKLADREKLLLENVNLAEKQETANQQGFDVDYYALDLLPDPFTRTLTGSVTIRAEVVAELLDFFPAQFTQV